MSSSAKARKLNEKAQDKMDDVEEKVVESIDKARNAGGELAEKAVKAEQEVRDAIDTAASSISEYIVEKPLQAAGIAFAAGVLTTLLLTRRR